MEVDVPSIAHRTRASTKRARSPSSPTQYDRPSKRVSSGIDTSVPFPFPAMARVRGRSEDWVSQTQGLRLESPSLENSGYSTPVSIEEVAGVRIDEVMVDEPMNREDNAMSISPPRPTSVFSQASHTPILGTPTPSYPPTPSTYQNPNRLQIPAIQIQAATPSPVQMFPQQPLPDTTSPPASASDVFFAAASDQVPAHSPPLLSLPQQQQDLPPQPCAGLRKQRFTMGPRADCELCRMHVKGHYMHFD